MTPNLLGRRCADSESPAMAPRSVAHPYSYGLAAGKAASDGLLVLAGTTASRGNGRHVPKHTAKAIETVANLLCGHFQEIGISPSTSGVDDHPRLTPHGRRRTSVPFSFPVADRTPEWLAHAAPIMVCVAGCGIGKTTHHWPTQLCSDCWLDARRRGEV